MEMKRTQLRRRSGLKRGTSTLKRTRLKQMSDAKTDWSKKYESAKAKHPPPMLGMEAHHPFGRIGERILCFIWVFRATHQAIHDRGIWAREVGWLQPPFDGRPMDNEYPRPWPKELECFWPPTYKRP